MIQKGTYVRVVDNSGAKLASCIHVYGGYQKRYAKMGDYILVSVKTVRKKNVALAKVKKKDILKALVLSTKTKFSVLKGFSTQFFLNSVVLLNAQKKQLSTRIFFPLSKFFRGTRHLKLISLSSGVLN